MFNMLQRPPVRLLDKAAIALSTTTYAVTIYRTELGDAGSKCNTIICSGRKPTDS